MSMLTIPSVTTPSLRRSTLVLIARLRRHLHRWTAAVIARCERQAGWHALQQSEGPNNRRIYHSPIDDFIDRAARLSRKRLKQP